jgi:poly-beta-1,6-N-acetyl-D-glucosamine synthase
MDWWHWVFLGGAAVYAAGILWLVAGIGRVRQAEKISLPVAGEKPVEPGGYRVSVHVAARNEAECIGACLEALRCQDYAGDYQVIVVDDRSDDDTAAIVEAMAATWPRLKLVRAPQIPRFRCPKKSALAVAIEAGAGELLLFTDADCEPEPGWISAMASGFSRQQVGLVAGYSPHRQAAGLKNGILALDNMAVAALSAGSIGMGRALASTGRSLAYRRRVYNEVGGFEPVGHLLGGDDVYFMRLVGQTSWEMAYNRRMQGAVWSQAGPEQWRQIIQQKLRHAAKAGHYGGPALLLGGMVYLFHALLFWGLLCMIGNGTVQWWRGELGSDPGGWFDPLVIGVWAGRWALDWVLLWRFTPGASQRRCWRFLPLLEIAYIPYILLFTVAGRLGLFRWK